MKLFRREVLLLVCLFSVLETSCSVTTPSEINAKYSDVFEQRHDHYRLKPGDEISIELYNLDSDLDQSANLILPDGRSDLFHLHDVQIAGKTVPAFEAELREKLAEEFRNDVPETKIQVRPAEAYIYVYGEFERPPGRLAFTEKMTLREAIAAAGGMRVTGDTDWALLTRPYRDPRQPDLFRIDLNDRTEALFLLPGDQVMLGRTFFATVGRYLGEYVFSIFAPAFSTAAVAATAF